MNNWYKTLCVVNPVSANGRTKKTWANLASYLKQQGLEFDVKFTDQPKDATYITREALHKDYQRIVAVGGDGTLNEVVNGFYNGNCEKIKDEAFLSFIPMGTGGDFARMFDISSNPAKAYDILAHGQESPIDIVKGTFTGWNGSRESRYYINVADVGLGSEAVYYVNRNSKVLRGFLSFLISGLYSVFTYENKLLTVIVDDKEVYIGRSSIVVVSNGCYFGGGMKIAPHASINDGLLDVIIAKDLSKIDLMRNVPKIYSGQHLNDPNIDFINGKKVNIISKENLYVELDGETPGTGNLEFEIMPAEMKLIL